jgi:hypothetical protein
MAAILDVDFYQFLEFLVDPIFNAYTCVFNKLTPFYSILPYSLLRPNCRFIQLMWYVASYKARAGYNNTEGIK